jgi:hypothetical protein
MKKASLFILPLAFAVAGSATASDRPASSASVRPYVPSVSIATPAYYYNYLTHSSGTVTTGSSVGASAKTTSSTSNSKSTSSTGTKTVSSTGTTTTGTTTIPSFGATTTIYAAIRTDGIAGSGTKQNPYDASTEAKFDAILANLFKANGAQRTALSLGAGTYTITPIRVASTSANPAGFVSNLPGNFEIIGAGMDKTIIRAGIVPTGSSTYWVLSCITPEPGDFIENLTLDCNIQNQTAPKLTIDGIQQIHVNGGATNTVAANVHIIDGGNRPNDPGESEWFGINFSDGQTGSVNEITQCRVDQYQGNGGCTALVCSGLLTNNTVTLNNNDPDGMSGNGGGGGFQDAYSPAPVVTGNTCKNCTWGVYSDVDDQYNVDIENNNFQTLYGGVWLYDWSATASLQKIYVHNNTISKTYVAAVVVGCASSTVTNSNIFVYDNTITTVVTPTCTVNNLVYITAAKDSEIFGNTFSVSPATKTLPVNISESGDLSSLAWYGNTFSNGTTIPGLAGTVSHALSGVTAPPAN